MPAATSNSRCCFTKTVDAVISPDGKFKAVRVTLAAGGAAPFCVDNVAVRLAIYPDDFDEHKNVYEVYAAPCGRVGGRVVPPRLEWLSATALQIAVAPRAASADAKNIRTKDIDASKSVHVTVVERE